MAAMAAPSTSVARSGGRAEGGERWGNRGFGDGEEEGRENVVWLWRKLREERVVSVEAAIVVGV